jgi:hypothetical protein
MTRIVTSTYRYKRPPRKEEAGPDRGSGDRAERRGEARDATGASQR